MKFFLKSERKSFLTMTSHNSLNTSTLHEFSSVQDYTYGNISAAKNIFSAFLSYVPNFKHTGFSILVPTFLDLNAHNYKSEFNAKSLINNY